MGTSSWDEHSISWLLGEPVAGYMLLFPKLLPEIISHVNLLSVYGVISNNWAHLTEEPAYFIAILVAINVPDGTLLSRRVCHDVGSVCHIHVEAGRAFTALLRLVSIGGRNVQLGP